MLDKWCIYGYYFSLNMNTRDRCRLAEICFSFLQALHRILYCFSTVLGRLFPRRPSHRSLWNSRYHGKATLFLKWNLCTVSFTFWAIRLALTSSYVDVVFHFTLCHIQSIPMGRGSQVLTKAWSIQIALARNNLNLLVLRKLHFQFIS